MPDKKLTPMMELIECINNGIHNKKEIIKAFGDSNSRIQNSIHSLEKIKIIAAELLEKERQMVVKSYKNGEQNASLPDMFVLTAEQYYTQTYKS